MVPDPQQFMIKVCGITNLKDARSAVDWGANTLGLNFYPGSPRCIDHETAQWIGGNVAGRALVVAVVVVEPEAALGVLQEIRRRVPSIGAFQLHGLDKESDVPRLDLTCYVATSAEKAPAFPGHPIVIDSSWGRGERADWEGLKGLGRSFILSGGLTPENVVDAIGILSPAGVDVCSGVESSPGVKDGARLRRFLGNAERALAGRMGAGRR